MPFQVTIENTDETFRCRDEDNVLQAMEQLRRKGIPVGCRNGGCGVCKVKVIEGRYAKKKMSRAVVSEEDEARGCVLACRIYPQSDLRVRVEGKMLRAVFAGGGMSFGFEFSTTPQVIRSGTTTRNDIETPAATAAAGSASSGSPMCEIDGHRDDK